MAAAKYPAGAWTPSTSMPMAVRRSPARAFHSTSRNVESAHLRRPHDALCHSALESYIILRYTLPTLQYRGVSFQLSSPPHFFCVELTDLAQRPNSQRAPQQACLTTRSSAQSSSLATVTARSATSTPSPRSPVAPRAPPSVKYVSFPFQLMWHARLLYSRSRPFAGASVPARPVPSQPLP